MKIDLIYQSKDRRIEDCITKTIEISNLNDVYDIFTFANNNKLMLDLGYHSTKVTIYELIGFEAKECCENCTHSVDGKYDKHSYTCEDCWNNRREGYWNFKLNDENGIFEGL